MLQLKVLTTLVSFSILAITGSFSFAQAGAVEKNGNFLVTVQSQIADHQTVSWSEKQCTLIHQYLASGQNKASNIICISPSIDVAAAQKISEAKSSKKFSHQIAFTENTNGTLRLDIENWRTDRDDTDFVHAGWNIDSKEPTEQAILLQKLLRNFLAFETNLRPIKEMLLVTAAQESQLLALSPSGKYVHRETLKRLDFKDAWNLAKEENVRQKHFFRAAIEIAITLGNGVRTYYSRVDENKVDWEFSGWEGFRRKVKSIDLIRFDNNSMPTNRDHALAGALYMGISRFNGLTLLESFLYAFTASAVWEYLCEYQEKVSINDSIITPVGGFAIGEVWYQFGKFFNSGGDHPVNQVLSYFFGGLGKLHEWLDKNKIPRAKNIGKYGFNEDVWHRIDLFAGYATGSGPSVTPGENKNDSGINLGVDMQLFMDPHYGKEGSVKRVFLDTAYVRFLGETSLGKDALSEIHALAKATFMGLYSQDVRKDEKERLNGYSFFLGASTEMEYRNMGKEGATNDWYSVVNVVGPSLDVMAYRNGMRIHFKMDVYGDFAMIRSLALEEFKKENDTAGLKTVLENKGYYFGWGYTSANQLTLDWKGFELGASSSYHYVSSIEGKDRYQESVTQDLKNRDKVLSLRTWFSHPIYSDRVKFVYSAERIDRMSKMDQYKKSTTSNHYLGQIVFLF